eukprot:793438-Heterocapsa_arctica.AAC.1
MFSRKTCTSGSVKTGHEATGAAEGPKPQGLRRQTGAKHYRREPQEAQGWWRARMNSIHTGS